MTITILDIESTYRKLFNAPDAEARAALFEREIAMPFSSLAQRFGGPGAFAQWGMSPEQFAGGSSAPQAKPFATLVQADAWHKAARAVEDARAAFEKHADLSVVGDITFALLLTQPQTYGGIDIGYAGFGAIPGAVMVTYSRPTRENVKAVQAATAHEMHHQFVGWLYGQGAIIASLASYMVNEGLAESFGAALYGADKVGPWVTEFDMTRLEETKARFRDAFALTDFNTVRQYIFGDPISGGFSGSEPIGIPAYAGYALGYHTVQAYMRRTGKSVIETTLVPPLEIIEESRFFA